MAAVAEAPLLTDAQIGVISSQMHRNMRRLHPKVTPRPEYAMDKYIRIT
jgi:hypothetical protein